MPNVAFVRPEYAALIDQYNLIRDAVAGETAVKKAKTAYLPMPNAEDTSAENKARYTAYLKRAVFYNVTRNTLAGLVGQVFMRDPEITIPTLLEPVNKNASGTGISLTQQSKKALKLTLAYSRAGVLVDYPDTAEPATQEDIATGRIRPTITVYSPQEIINWRVVDRGADEILNLVVLAELYCFADDGFEMKNAMQFRVLRLEDGTGDYVIDLYREPQPTVNNGDKQPRGNFLLHKTIRPKGADGQPLKEILFSFIGSENNDADPDNPNMYDLASLNMAHYRNSADYEESCFVVGQPTPVATGLTQEWVTEVLKGTLNFGSRGGIMLPSGASFELVQADPNTMLKEAMEAKERQMVAIGAKLVEQKQVQRTAFEAKIEATSEGSTLSSTTKNVAAAFDWALKWCAKLLGLADAGIEFKLNTDFDIARMTVEERQEAIKEWQAGALTFNEMRSVLRKAGTATEDDDKAKAQIAADTAEAMALVAENTPPDPSGNTPPAGGA